MLHTSVARNRFCNNPSFSPAEAADRHGRTRPTTGADSLESRRRKRHSGIALHLLRTPPPRLYSILRLAMMPSFSPSFPTERKQLFNKVKKKVAGQTCLEMFSSFDCMRVGRYGRLGRCPLQYIQLLNNPKVLKSKNSKAKERLKLAESHQKCEESRVRADRNKGLMLPWNADAIRYYSGFLEVVFWRNSNPLPHHVDVSRCKKCTKERTSNAQLDIPSHRACVHVLSLVFFEFFLPSVLREI